jgi:hypothetical protein
MTKNLIIGAATGYKYGIIQHFFNSLKKINFKGDVAILVSDKIDAATKRSLEEHGVILIYVKSSKLAFSRRYANSRLWKIHYLPHKLLYGLLNTGKNKLQKLSNYVKRFHLISGSRFCYYYDYLLENKDKYKFILITDVRDVVFQADPFAEIKKDELLNFYEQDDTIEENFYTGYWVKNGFGKKAFSAIKDKKSICSGTTIGAVGRIIDYLEKMIAVQAMITGGLTGLGGFDQGVHNYLIYNNYFPGSNVVLNTAGEVVTLENLSCVGFNEEQELVNKDKEVIPVVHCYDRFPDLKFKAIV